MVSNDFYVEKLLCKDAEKIVIDEEFKCDLKNKIMFGEKHSNVTQLPKYKNRFKKNKYLKIASGFVICVVVSGTIFKAIDVPSMSIFTKNKLTPDVITPIVTGKTLAEIESEKTDALKSKEALASKNSGNKIPVVVKDSKSSTIANTSEKDSKVNDATINKDTDKVNPVDKNAVVPNSVDKPGKDDGVLTEVMVSIKASNVSNSTNIPKMENVKEDVSSSLKIYDSSYSLGEKSLVNVKEGAIYVKDVESSKEKKLIAYNEETQIVEKPNFTPNNEIIYYKAEKVTADNGDSVAKNGAIYLTDKNGQESSKIVDGKNPMISKDGKNLVYEIDGKIYILNLASRDKRFVDEGKEPAFSDNGNTISYVKEGKETQNYDASTGKKDVYIQKTFSSLWVFDLATEKTHSLTDNEVNINNKNIQSWATAVKNGTITSDLEVNSKYSYFESVWSSDNKEIYVIRKNNDLKIFELIKVELRK
ncbi:TolB family protein [Clostridium sp.]|uniref:TolB family protein n=1 Tax=Clostridium sp. TaxID=1506 RepID=UPI003D6C86BF